MTGTAEGTHRTLSLRKLGRAAPYRLAYTPDPQAIAEIAGRLDLLSLKKVRLTGQLLPEGSRDWRLEAQIGATAAQPCSVTLAPVTTRVDAPVQRLYTDAYADPEDAEAESPEDDSIEPIPTTLDLAEVLAEALALALPDFPRAPDAELGAAQATPPGAEPLTDADTNPFQALAALKDDVPRPDQRRDRRRFGLVLRRAMTILRASTLRCLARLRRAV